MKRHIALFATLTLFAAAAPVGSLARAADALVIDSKDIKFDMADPKDPMAGEMAVLAGDPSKPGPFTVRARLKAGAMVKTHSHSADEYVTILSGKARMSFGDVPDEAHAKNLTAGGFLYLPAGQTHTLWIDEDVVGDIYSTGPFDEKYMQN